MISATEILRTPPMRIGKITENLVLPRTVEVKKLLATLAGFFLGVILWIFAGTLIGYSYKTFIVLTGIFAITGLVLVSWSPLKGESFATWLGLATTTKIRDKVEINGKQVRAYIGIAPLRFTASGRITIKPSAVDVYPGSFDERGVPISQNKYNH
jgi:hypothetical protein